MLADGCIRFPVLAVDIAPSIQFQERNNDTHPAAPLNASNIGRRHLDFSPEELARHPFALLAGRVFKVTLRGALSSSPNRRFHFSAQYLYAPHFDCLLLSAFPQHLRLLIDGCAIHFFFIPCNSMAVRNEVPFAYLLQHDHCADTSLLKHQGSIVLQAPIPTIALCSCDNRAFLFRAPFFSTQTQAQWKQKCESCSSDACIFVPGSTVNEGRNALWAELLRLYPGTVFSYIILLDGEHRLSYQPEHMHTKHVFLEGLDAVPLARQPYFVWEQVGDSLECWTFNCALFRF